VHGVWSLVGIDTNSDTISCCEICMLYQVPSQLQVILDPTKSCTFEKAVPSERRNIQCSRVKVEDDCM